MTLGELTFTALHPHFWFIGLCLAGFVGSLLIDAWRAYRKAARALCDCPSCRKK